METKKQSAFPILESWNAEYPEILVCNQHGLTKREYIACKLMQGYLSNPQFHLEADEQLAKVSVVAADLLIEELNKQE